MSKKSNGTRKPLGTALPCLIALSSVVTSGCGGSSEPARSPSASEEAPTIASTADDAAASEPGPSDSADPDPAPSSPEVASVVDDPSELASEAGSSNRLASELEKRRRAARAGEAEQEAKPAEPAIEESAAPAYKGPDPCRATSFHLDRVREACESGGRAAAKRVMRDAITKAIAMSQSLVCADCHVNQKDFELKPNAVDDLKGWLEGL